MSERSDIREGLRARVATALPDFTVELGRYDQIPPAKLPLACLYAMEETREIIAKKHPRLRHHNLTITIELAIQATTAAEIESDLDTHSVAVEAAISEDPKLAEVAGADVKDCVVRQITFEANGHGKAHYGMAILEVAVQYETTEATA